MRAITTVLTIAVLAAAAACSDAPLRPADPTADFALPEPAPATPELEAAQSLGRGANVASVPASSTDAAGARGSEMIIRNGSASVEVDSLEPAVAAIRRLVARAGGYIGNTALQAGDESLRSAVLELRIPAERFDEVVAGLAPVGEVEFVNVSAEDVGEQYMDLDARAANARRLESRLIDLLAGRTGKLADVLAVERELSRVREEIERLDGRMRWLRSRAALSSLSVSVHEPGPLVGRPGDHPIGDAVRQAWRNAVTFLAWAIAASGVIVPLAVLAGVGLSLWRRFGSRRRTAAATPAECG